jgi:site-specific DNA recombinase
VRPGLERIRELAAEGQVLTVLALSPDRLSRKYGYQVLLIEELARHGVEMIFLKAPRSATPEDQLLLQFQGMIAEYERAQILERARRGKRPRAKQGEVGVLSGAPSSPTIRHSSGSQKCRPDFGHTGIKFCRVEIRYNERQIRGSNVWPYHSPKIASGC